MNNRGTIALSQILILVIGFVAATWMIGGVSAVGGGSSTPTFTNINLENAQSLKAGDTIVYKIGGKVQSATVTSVEGGYIRTNGDTWIPTDRVNLKRFGVQKYNPSTTETTSGTVLGGDSGQWAAVGKNFLYGVGIGAMLGGIIGMFAFSDNPQATSALTLSLAAGGGVGAGLYEAFGTGGMWENTFIGRNFGAGGGIAIGVVVAAAIFYLMYSSEDQYIITYSCLPWDAPTGGNDCQECNDQDLPCSEYQCRSLGQSCQLLNAGTTEELCDWVNRKDTEYPTIQPWTDALLDGYEYSPDNTISPPDRGVQILMESSTTGCVKAFTPLTFGITLNEPGKCKIDYLRRDSFDEMEYFFGGSSMFRYNHTQIMSLPGPNEVNSENITLFNDGNYELYVRCQDANGNANVANFVFKYCVEEGPDTTPPLIVTTSLLNNMPIAYDQKSVDLDVYTNEPASCKWSREDQDYDEMETTMSCSSGVLEMNAQMLYKCKTTLDGLKNGEENNFYFRCEDKSEDKNQNEQSYEFTVLGTQKLAINSVGPNGTIKDSTDPVKVTLEVETIAGFSEGEAICEYGEEDGVWIDQFFNTNSYEHTQDLFLPEGSYEYFVKCCDLGNNCDTESIEFDVESDSNPPQVVRAFHEESYLKVTTNEESSCVYDTQDCSYSFDDGIAMSSTDDLGHFADWNTKTSFYIKCKDEFGNEPGPDECSIIARPFEFFEE